MMRALIAIALTAAAPAATPASATPASAPGWKIELVAQAPDIRHPSVVCTAPDGRVFVAEDPMDIREDMPASSRHGRIVCLHPDGRRTVFAEKLHAVFGMQYLEGNLNVLHNPLLTVFRDEDGVGRGARDIITHTLPEPWAQDWNDHIPANFKLGMDGWFYLAVGDKGLYGCTGSDGRVLNLRGGGIVRFRPDGSGLEIFSTGVRNILDVALNAEDEMFTYDNTDEHEWMGRFTHMVEAGDYGYPHNFIPRRPDTLWMMHDFGAGAACGTICATDAALAPEMAGHVFIADFGQRQVTRVKMQRDGATWRVTGSEGIFQNPPDDFRPVGLAWMPDGRGFYLCDWQHRDTKENVDAGRVWRVTWTGAGGVPQRPDWWQPLAMGKNTEVPQRSLLEALAHPALTVRMAAQRALAGRSSEVLRRLLVDEKVADTAKIHALWALDAGDGGAAARKEILAIAGGEKAALAAQALRQLSQRSVGDAVDAALHQLAHPDATVRLQAATLLGRVAATAECAGVLVARLGTEADATVRYALFTGLRRMGGRDGKVWPEVLAGFASVKAAVREGCSFAVREVWSAPLIPLLRERAMSDPLAAERLGESVFQPAPVTGSWWSYHPAKSPAPPRNTRWDGTEAALVALRDVLAHATAPGSRRQAAVALGEARDAASSEALRQRLATDDSPAVRSSALAALALFKDEATAPVIAKLLRAADTDAAVRLAAIRSAPQFGPELAPELIASLESKDETVRLAVITALEPMKSAAAREPLRRVLREGSTAEQTAAIKTLAASANRELVPDFLAVLSGVTDPNVGRAAMLALAAVPDVRAIPAFLDALATSDPVRTDAARKALGNLGASAMPTIAERIVALPSTVSGALRDIFKDNAEAVAHPAYAQLGGSDAATYLEYAMKHVGEAWRGQQIFHGSAGVSCAACHQVAGHGGVIGPDLTLAGKQFSRTELIESILYPSKAIRDGYRQTLVTTTDGRELVGVAGATVEGVTVKDLAGTTTAIAAANIKERRELPTSLMPEGLHAALTVEQFTDVVAYMVTRKTDPRTEAVAPLPEGFTPLFDGRDLTGWRMSDLNRTHWSVKDGRLEHDGITSDLWSERDFGDFTLHVEWRWPGAPVLADHPVIGPDGRTDGKLQRVLEAGDSGVFLRGLYKAQANLFCYPVGSGEFWEYREDAGQPRDFAPTVTPKQRADAPVGDWNTMQITVRASTVNITLNGHAIIEATLPDLPARGPIGFQHEHGRVQFRAIGIKEFSSP
jgi:putative membrane-bound dehydrogenase-like protein